MLHSERNYISDNQPRVARCSRVWRGSGSHRDRQQIERIPCELVRVRDTGDYTGGTVE